MLPPPMIFFFFFFNDTATTEIYTLSLHDALPILVLVFSGLQIFRAFPSFGAKIPQKDLLHWPKTLAVGGWLGGGLQWHLTFMWIYVVTGLVYLSYELFSGNYRQVLFTHRDIPGVWPMVKHYFF